MLKARAVEKVPPSPVRLEVPAVAALIALTMVVLPGTRGVLGSGRSLMPVVAAALLMHGVAWWSRRHLGQLGLLAGFGGCSLLLIWIAVPSSTAFGIPWAGSVQAVATSARRALEEIGEGLPANVADPPLVHQGRLVVALFLVMLCALLADQVAFRMRRGQFALVPSLTVVVLGATRMAFEHRARTITVYLTVAMVFLLLHRRWSEQPGGPASMRPGRLLPRSSAAAALLIAATVGSALVAGPRFPGYGKAPLVAAAGSILARQAGSELRGLVDMKPTLSERADSIMFTVRSPVPSYWRLTSLDRFDGRRWTKSSERSEGGVAAPRFGDDASFDQLFEIDQLRSEWVPVAYEVRRVEGRIQYAILGDGTVRSRSALQFGEQYRVSSVVRRVRTFGRPDDQGEGGAPPNLKSYLALPAGLSPRVSKEAERVARGQHGSYLTARLLQEYFRNGFTYDLRAEADHDGDALVDFLFRTRRGYCEQFAAAYAVMARMLDLPSRVAVGFTPGEVGQGGLYEVRGRNAHAWPEVYLAGTGWVAFEPTPGRGMPGAEYYTGVAPAQAQTQTGTIEESLPAVVPDTTPAPTVAASVPSTGATPPTATPTTGDVVADPASQSTSTGTGDATGLRILALLAGGLFAAGSVPVVKRVRRRRRRQRAESPNQEVIVAWQDAADALIMAGAGRRPSETLLEHAARAAVDGHLPQGAAQSLLTLGRLAGTASYAGRPLEPDVAVRARDAADAVVDAVRESAPLPRRIGNALDPRPLLARS